MTVEEPGHVVWRRWVQTERHALLIVFSKSLSVGGNNGKSPQKFTLKKIVTTYLIEEVEGEDLLHGALCVASG